MTNIPEQHKQAYEYALRLIPVLPDLPLIIHSNKLFKYIGVGLPHLEAKKVMRMLVTMRLLGKYKDAYGLWQNVYSKDYEGHWVDPEVPQWWKELSWK